MNPHTSEKKEVAGPRKYVQNRHWETLHKTKACEQKQESAQCNIGADSVPLHSEASAIEQKKTAAQPANPVLIT